MLSYGESEGNFDCGNRGALTNEWVGCELLETRRRCLSYRSEFGCAPLDRTSHVKLIALNDRL
jgi:hypothetical protein